MDNELNSKNQLGDSLGEQFDLHKNSHSYVIAFAVAVVIGVNLLLLGIVTGGSAKAQNVSQPPAPLTSRVDTDRDGFKDYLESAIGTDVNNKCGVNAWPPDINNDGIVNSLDLSIESRMVSKKGDSGYDKRFDLNTDSAVDAADLNLVAKYASRNCQTANHPQSDTQVGCTRADINKDGLVNQEDLNAIAAKFGTNDATADINGDGNVNAIDLSTVSQESLGKTCKSDVSQLAAFAGNMPACESADINKDSIVNSIDLSLVAQKFGTNDAKTDVNADKIVNALDLHIVSNYFSQTCVSQAQAVAQAEAITANIANPTKESCLKGDINKDGIVNSSDQSLVTQNYGKKGTSADVNGDGIVSSIDMQIVFSSYGKKCGDLQAAPTSGTSASTPSSTTQSSTPAESPKPVCTLRGDITKDGIVNSIDMSQISQALNNKSQDPKYDVNGDGIVNSLDIQQVSVNQGKSC